MQLLHSRQSSSSSHDSICPDSVSPQHRALPLLRRCLLSVCGHVSVQHVALYEAAGAVRAGEDGQGEVSEGVPQQGAQGELGEVTHTAAQTLRTHVAQQVVSNGLRRRWDTNMNVRI